MFTKILKKKLKVKKQPTKTKVKKYRYMYRFSSYNGCSSTCNTPASVPVPANTSHYLQWYQYL